MRNIVLALSITAALAFAGCASNANVEVGDAKTPTEAYKMLFSAVKSKDPEKIKKMLSQSTLKFAEARSAQTQQSVDEIVRNGFSAPAMSENLPQIRDEQTSEQFGMIEVLNSKTKMWEMVPFVNENGGWKLAVGEAFSNTWKQPGKPQSQLEMENANVNPPQMVPGANIDWNNVKPIKIDPKSGNISRGPNPTLGNVKPQKIPTH